jgi:methyl-accepting chemotaxis protein
MPALGEVGKYFQEAINAETALSKAQGDAKEIYETKTLAALGLTSEAIGKIKTEAERLPEGAREANAIYDYESLPALQATQKLLNDTRVEAKKHIMTDEIMLNAAQGIKRNETIVGVVAIVVGISLSFVTASVLTIDFQNQLSAQQQAQKRYLCQAR